MINKSKRTFRSFDILSMVVLLGVVVGISGLIVTRELSDIDHSMALSDAQSLAFQLVQGGFDGGGRSERGPAAINKSNASLKNSLGIFQTIGEIGKDPWGQMFQYRVLKQPDGRSAFVVVWSFGPNLERETDDTSFQMDVGKSVADLEFKGDDFGYIHPIK